MLKVNTHRRGVGCPGMDILIDVKTRIEILWMEDIIAWFPSVGRSSRYCRIAVVHLMITPIGIELHLSGRNIVIVVDVDGCRATYHAGPHVDQRVVNRTGIVRFCLCHGDIGAGIPMIREFIAKLTKLACQPCTAVLAMTIRALIRGTHKGIELTIAVAEIHSIFLSAVAAPHKTSRAVESLLCGMLGDDIYRPSHGIWAVKHGRRTTDHLNLSHITRCICVGQRMSEYRCPLRLSVYHEEHLIAPTHSTDADSSGCSPGYTKTKDTAFGHKETRHMVRKYRENIRLCAFFNLVRIYDRYA